MQEAAVNVPYRERSAEKIIEGLRRARINQGASTASWFAFNWNTHSEIHTITRAAMREIGDVGLISMRIDTLAEHEGLAELLKFVGNKSQTMGVEGCSQRIRDFLHKSVSTHDLLKGAEYLIRNNCSEMKFFMIASGQETKADIDEFIEVMKQINELKKKYNSKCQTRVSFMPLFNCLAEGGLVQTVQRDLTKTQYAPMGYSDWDKILIHEDKQFVPVHMPSNQGLECSKTPIPLPLNPTTGRQYRAEVNVPETLTKDLAILAGYWLGDGCYGGITPSGRVGLAFTDKIGSKVIPGLMKSMEVLFGKKCAFQESSTESSCHAHLNSAEIADFWEHCLGFETVSANQKRVPALFKSLPQDLTCAFLKGYFEADGGWGAKHSHKIETSSPLLASDIQEMLWSVGIPSVVRYCDRSEEDSRYGDKVWTCTVYSLDGMKRFEEHIQYLSDEKLDTMYTKASTRSERGQGLYIPCSLADLRQWRSNQPYEKRAAFTKLAGEVLKPSNGRMLPRELAQTLYEQFSDCPPRLKTLLEQTFENHIYYLPVGDGIKIRAMDIGKDFRTAKAGIPVPLDPLLEDLWVKTHQGHYRRITHAAYMGDRDTVFVTKDDNVLECTPDHKFWVAQDHHTHSLLDPGKIGEFIPAQDLKKFGFNVGEGEKIVPVFDLTVDEDHSFYCNGLPVHNCAFTALQFYRCESFYKLEQDTLRPLVEACRELRWGFRTGSKRSEIFISQLNEMSDRRLTPVLIKNSLGDPALYAEGKQEFEHYTKELAALKEVDPTNRVKLKEISDKMDFAEAKVKYGKGWIFSGLIPKHVDKIWQRWMRDSGLDIDYYFCEKDMDYVFPWDIIDISVTKEYTYEKWLQAKSFFDPGYCVGTLTKSGTCFSCSGCPTPTHTAWMTQREVEAPFSVQDLEAYKRDLTKKGRIRFLCDMTDPRMRTVKKRFFGRAIARAMLLSDNAITDIFLDVDGHSRTTASTNDTKDWVYGQFIVDLTFNKNVQDEQFLRILPQMNEILAQGGKGFQILSLKALPPSAKTLFSAIDNALVKLFIPSEGFPFKDISDKVKIYRRKIQSGDKFQIKGKEVKMKGVFKTVMKDLDTSRIKYVGCKQGYGDRGQFGTELVLLAANKINPYDLLEALLGGKAFQYRKYETQILGYYTEGRTNAVDLFSDVEDESTAVTYGCKKTGAPIEIDSFTGEPYKSLTEPDLCIAADWDSAMNEERHVIQGKITGDQPTLDDLESTV